LPPARACRRPEPPAPPGARAARWRRSGARGSGCRRRWQAAGREQDGTHSFGSLADAPLYRRVRKEALASASQRPTDSDRRTFPGMRAKRQLNPRSGTSAYVGRAGAGLRSAGSHHGLRHAPHPALRLPLRRLAATVAVALLLGACKPPATHRQRRPRRPTPAQPPCPASPSWAASASTSPAWTQRGARRRLLPVRQRQWAKNTEIPPTVRLQQLHPLTDIAALRTRAIIDEAGEGHEGDRRGRADPRLLQRLHGRGRDRGRRPEAAAAQLDAIAAIADQPRSRARSARPCAPTSTS
jgi:hypothetical protein